MAQQDYSTAKQPIDQNDKPFAGVATDSGSELEFVAVQGGTRATVQGKTVAPTMIELANSGALVSSGRVLANALPYNATVVMQNAANSDGNGTALDVTGLSTVAFQVKGTYTGYVYFEATVDGTNWVAMQTTDVSTNLALTNTPTGGEGVFVARVAGFTSVRARVGSFGGTSVTVTAHGVADSDRGQAPVSLHAKTTLAGDTALLMKTANDGGGGIAGLATSPYPMVWTGAAWNRLCVDTDDAAPQATATLLGMTGRYQATADELDDGDTGRIRLSVRRGVIDSGDSWVQANLYSGTPTDNSAHNVTVPLSGARAVGFYVLSSLDVNVTIKIYLYSVTQSVVYEETIGATARVIAPGAGGIGANSGYVCVPALAFPVMGNLLIQYTCASTPGSGSLRIDLGRLS